MALNVPCKLPSALRRRSFSSPKTIEELRSILFAHVDVLRVPHRHDNDIRRTINNSTPTPRPKRNISSLKIINKMSSSAAGALQCQLVPKFIQNSSCDNDKKYKRRGHKTVCTLPPSEDVSRADGEMLIQSPCVLLLFGVSNNRRAKNVATLCFYRGSHFGLLFLGNGPQGCSIC